MCFVNCFFCCSSSRGEAPSPSSFIAFFVHQKSFCIGDAPLEAVVEMLSVGKGCSERGFCASAAVAALVRTSWQLVMAASWVSAVAAVVVSPV